MQTESCLLNESLTLFSLKYLVDLYLDLEGVKYNAILFFIDCFYSLSYPQYNSNYTNSKIFVIHIYLLTSFNNNDFFILMS